VGRSRWAPELATIATTTRRMDSLVCHAEARRIARLEKQFAREVSTLLCYDEVLLNAMSPYREYTTYEDDILMAEVTEVVLSNDLQVAKVYVYFSGDDYDARMFAFENLKRKIGYIRKELSRKVKMRRAPEVRLIYDKSIEEQEKLDEIFAKLREERERSGKAQAAAGGLGKQEMEMDERDYLNNQDFYLDDHEEEEEEGSLSA